jgi:hypothetical protein
MLIVAAAEQPDPIRVVRTSSREPVEVVEFQSSGLGAPPTAFVDEGATSPVALEHRSLDGVRDVSRR